MGNDDPSSGADIAPGATPDPQPLGGPLAPTGTNPAADPHLDEGGDPDAAGGVDVQCPNCHGQFKADVGQACPECGTPTKAV